MPRRLRSLLPARRGRDRPWERSRRRWRAARPDANLTWGFELTGDAFIERAAAHGAFGPGRAVLEVGPGYGRLPRSALAAGVEFRRWTGLDLSEENVAHLRASFDDPRLEFRHGDAETSRFDERIDTVLSSLTFKHMYPSFEATLTNLAGGLASGGLVMFDLIEGERSYFEDDGVTYIRHYERDEVEEIVARSGLEMAAFDEVIHHPKLARLLAVARRP